MIKLDPQMQAIVDTLKELKAPPLSSLPLEVGRTGYEKGKAFTASDKPDIGKVEDRTVDGPAGPVPIRVYWPSGYPSMGALPVILFFHGGGYTIGNLESHDTACRYLVKHAAALLVAVDYRLAPEHPFPAAYEDCLAVTRWAAENIGALGGDATRMAVAGDSAGGNLATVVAQTCNDTGDIKLCHQLLIYPATDSLNIYPSLEKYAEGLVLSRETSEWFTRNYVGDLDRSDPKISPILGHLKGLPSTTILAAEYDVLIDQELAYAEALRKAGVSVDLRIYEGCVHDFITMTAIVDKAREALKDGGEALRRAFAN